jgi:hypothetical protein
MSQLRLAARDRLEAHNDDEFNRKAEEEVRAVLDHLSAQDEALTRTVETLAARMNGGAQDCSSARRPAASPCASRCAAFQPRRPGSRRAPGGALAAPANRAQAPPYETRYPHTLTVRLIGARL